MTKWKLLLAALVALVPGFEGDSTNPRAVINHYVRQYRKDSLRRRRLRELENL